VKKATSFLFAAVLTISLPVYADIYQWVDENGVVHFSDAPDPSAPADAITVQDAIRTETQTVPVSYKTAPPKSQGTSVYERELDNLIYEKENELEILENKHRNEITILKADLGQKNIRLKDASWTSEPEVDTDRGWDKYRDDREKRSKYRDDVEKAENAVAAVERKIRIENQNYLSEKRRLESQLTQLKLRKMR